MALAQRTMATITIVKKPGEKHKMVKPKIRCSRLRHKPKSAVGKQGGKGEKVPKGVGVWGQPQLGKLSKDTWCISKGAAGMKTVK